MKYANPQLRQIYLSASKSVEEENVETEKPQKVGFPVAHGALPAQLILAGRSCRAFTQGFEDDGTLRLAARNSEVAGNVCDYCHQNRGRLT